MKLAIRTVCFHFLCILVFAILYYNLQADFEHAALHERKSILDFVLLSTTIQASVGISDIYPITIIAKIVMISQQIIMIMTHVFTLYFFYL
jgi:hypothetical protein